MRNREPYIAIFVYVLLCYYPIKSKEYQETLKIPEGDPKNKKIGMLLDPVM